jgi:hypothetical protein
MMLKAKALLSVLIWAMCTAAGTGAQESFELYGYLTNYMQGSFRVAEGRFEEPSWGEVLVLRLKGDWKPGETLSVHLEGGSAGRLGNQNQGALLGEELPVEELYVDHAWGLANLGPVDLQFGKIPLAWGTGYVFNPTSRAAGAVLFDVVSEETPGTFALVPSVYVGRVTFTGYVAFQDKSHQKVSLAGAESLNNLPWGVKLQTFMGPFDVSAGLIREVLYVAGEKVSGYERGWYLSLDADGALGAVGVYAEAALKLAPEISFEERLEAAAGLYYNLIRRNGGLRLEVYHQGAGASDPTDYAIERVFALQQQMLAEDYLFASGEVGVMDYVRAGCEGLINLNDGSLVLLSQLIWDAAANLELATGGMVFAGPAGSEFDGRGLLDGEDLTESFSIFARVKLSF